MIRFVTLLFVTIISGQGELPVWRLRGLPLVGLSVARRFPSLACDLSLVGRGPDQPDIS